MNPFLTGDPSARSLNRARIVALHGTNPPDGILGMRGYPGLSAEHLTSIVQPQAAELGLDPESPTLLADLEIALRNPLTSWFATDIAQDFGIRLGYLLLMLKRGDPENREARPTWSAEHWAYWANVRNIMFGGGLMSGKFGRKALFAASNVLAAHGYPRMNLQRSPHGGAIGLIGLSKSVPAGAKTALLFDFGQTSVKRALLHVEEGRMENLGSVSADCYQNYQNTRTASEQWAWMQRVVYDSWQPVDAVCMSLAVYLQNGHPVERDTGCYGCMQELTPNLTNFIRDQLRQHGIDVPMPILHDGTAAAAAHADFNGVVITLGTAIGVGFPEEVSTA